MADPKTQPEAMLPPEGFLERAVTRGLAEVAAAEALRLLEDIEREPINDTVPPRPRKRRDSGIIHGVQIDDTPTIPFIRVAATDD